MTQAPISRTKLLKYLILYLRKAKGEEKALWVRKAASILFLPVLGRYILYQPGSSSPLSLSLPLSALDDPLDIIDSEAQVG